MQDILTIKNFVIYILIMNILGFLLMFLDKQKAKKNRWRIPEKTLLLITVLGGGIGSIIGMHTFKHKTQKMKFSVGFPVITILEIMLVIYLLITIR